MRCLAAVPAGEGSAVPQPPAHPGSALPARTAGPGQVTARSEKRKRKRVIHPSALPHLQSHAAFTHSLPSPINSFGWGALAPAETSPKTPGRILGVLFFLLFIYFFKSLP